MTEILTEIKDKRIAIDSVTEELVTAVRKGLKEGLTKAFEDPSVQTVAFGVSAAPYNDENMGQGTFGPAVNLVESSDEVSYHFLYDISEGGGNRSTSLLKSVLDAATWKYAAQALGVAYYEDEGSGRESAFLAVRADAPGGYVLSEHEQGY